jgi:peptidoglycan/xylan/chitin deacetylase (PgdA/CDA1 family)
MFAQLNMSLGLFTFQLQKRAQKKQSVILMYHRVIDPSKTDEYIEPGMYVTPATFEMHLQLLTKYFEVVSLQHLIKVPTVPSRKPKCAITFDDGWIDFYTNAYPLLNVYKVPATVFLPTNYIGTNQWFWTDRLATILNKSTGIPAHSTSDTLVSKISQQTGSIFSRVDAAIKLLKPHPQETIEKILDQLELHYTGSKTNHKRAFLDWYECRTMRTGGLVSFGSHTANHIILTSENAHRCKEELYSSNKKLIDEEVTDNSFFPFCYPNGGFTDKSADLVKETGYHCAVTTKGGWISGRNDLYSLNRIGIHQDMTSTPALLLSRFTSQSS